VIALARAGGRSIPVPAVSPAATASHGLPTAVLFGLPVVLFDRGWGGGPRPQAARATRTSPDLNRRARESRPPSRDPPAQLDASSGASWTISCGVRLAAYSVVILPLALTP